MGQNASVRRLVYLGVFVALLIGVDVATRTFVQAAVNTRAEAEAPRGSKASATIGAFPFLPPLLFAGRVSHVGVHLENLPARVLTFAEVDIDLHGVRVDRGRLFTDFKARLTRIDHGAVSVVITQQALGEALRLPVRMEPGRLSVTVAGRSIEVTPGVDAQGRLTLRGAGLPRPFTLAALETDYVPCVDEKTTLTVLAGRMRLSCVIDEVPPALLEAVQRDQ